MKQYTKILIVEDRELITWSLKSIVTKKFKEVEMVLYAAASFEEWIF